MIDNQTKEKFIELRVQGKSYDAISKELGVSKPTLIKLSKELSDTIANLQIIELETLKEKYNLQNTGKIKVLGEQIERVVEEIRKRDLKDLSTEKLFGLLTKYYSCISTNEAMKFIETVDGSVLHYQPPNREDAWRA